MDRFGRVCGFVARREFLDRRPENGLEWGFVPSPGVDFVCVRLVSASAAISAGTCETRFGFLSFVR